MPKNKVKPKNFMVRTAGWSGVKYTPCSTKKEVWDAIGAASFGALYEVTSPTGRPCEEFVPF